MPPRKNWWAILATTRPADRRIDAFLWSGGLPIPAVADLARRRPIRLLPLTGQLSALRRDHGTVYAQAVVPQRVYGVSEPVPTIGVSRDAGPVRLPQAVEGGATVAV